jgi:hypothetical protein
VKREKNDRRTGGYEDKNVNEYGILVRLGVTGEYAGDIFENEWLGEVRDIFRTARLASIFSAPRERVTYILGSVGLNNRYKK